MRFISKKILGEETIILEILLIREMTERNVNDSCGDRLDRKRLSIFVPKEYGPALQVARYLYTIYFWSMLIAQITRHVM